MLGCIKAGVETTSSSRGSSHQGHSHHHITAMFPILILLFAWAITAVLGSPITPESNIGTFVNLRVEGLDKTLFEGFVFTRGHNVTTESGGDHHCDGTNNHENPTPGPTCTSALDDAGHKADFTFDG